MSTTNNRPEWAQGTEWDGWEGKATIYRGTNGFSEVRIERWTTQNGYQYRVDDVCVSSSRYRPHLRVSSPETALAIANLIAEDRGGWAE